MLDLSALDGSLNEFDPSLDRQANGKPLEIPLADIDEDPNQPRKEFTKKDMEEITASIKLDGVICPISVRTHPEIPGRWMLNHGARRYRGSLGAGRVTIPAFIDEAHNSYHQVIENIQRKNLKPMELALFIKSRLEEGDKKGDIAGKLGKDNATITHHLSLIDAPGCIEAAYRTGKCRSAKVLYNLRLLQEKYPAEVDEWCESVPEITRQLVSVLGTNLKRPDLELSLKDDSVTEARGDSDDQEFGTFQISSSESQEGETEQEETVGRSSKRHRVEKSSDADDGKEKDLSDLTSWPKGRAVSDPDRMAKPLLLVECDGRSAAVLLNRRPTTAGLIFIRYEDGGGDEQVDAGSCKINLLTEDI